MGACCCGHWWPPLPAAAQKPWTPGLAHGNIRIYLPILLGGPKELGIVYINIIRGAKEPRNLQNHRGDMIANGKEHTKYYIFMGVDMYKWELSVEEI